MLTYDDNQKATKAHCRLAFSAQPQRFFLPLLVGLHGSTDTTARKSAIIEEKMFWKVTLPSTLIFSAKMFAQLTLQFLFIYIFICNRVRSVSFSNGGLRDCDIIFSNETDIAHVFCFLSCLVKFPAREANSWRRRASPNPGIWVCVLFFFPHPTALAFFHDQTHTLTQTRKVRRHAEIKAKRRQRAVRFTRFLDYRLIFDSGRSLGSNIIWFVHGRIN